MKAHLKKRPKSVKAHKYLSTSYEALGDAAAAATHRAASQRDKAKKDP